MAVKDSYLVIGGCGFVGRHIVEQLLARGEPAVAVFDLVQRHYDTNVQFFTGDICDKERLGEVIRQTNTTCIIHTASPIHGSKPEMFWKVNVEGTQAVIDAAQANGVPKLVYTSSAGITYTGEDLIDIDERLPPVNDENPYDTYNLTKAKAEALVLEANGKEGLYTVAIRPAGIFGPGDRQNFVGLAEVIRRGQTKWQIGNNDNLFDWTYVGNVAKAHLLAADKLLEKPQPQDDLIGIVLPRVTLTTRYHRVPTSLARPIGPAVTPPPNAHAIETAFRKGDPLEDRFPYRTKYDALTEANLEKELENPLQVAGQAFYITNGEPMAFWDYMLAVWKALGHEPPPRWIIPHTVGMYLGTAAEWWAWLTGRKPGFTRERVGYASRQRYFNIEKARLVLGYEPDVGLQEGIRISAKWFLEQQGVDAIKPE